MEASSPDFLDSQSRSALWNTYRFPLILGIGSLAIIVICIFWTIRSIQNQKPIEFSHTQLAPTGEVAGETSVGEVVVDVSGAVKNPGVYHLPGGSRVEDAILAAGGLSENVDSQLVAKNINRAALLINGGKLYLPTFGDISTSYNNLGISENTATSHNNIDSQNVGVASQNQTGMLVSVNTGSYQQLVDLSGIGPATANKLISGRPYQNLNDLVNRKILGQKLFDKLKSSLTL